MDMLFYVAVLTFFIIEYFPVYIYTLYQLGRCSNRFIFSQINLKNPLAPFYFALGFAKELFCEANFIQFYFWTASRGKHYAHKYFIRHPRLRLLAFIFEAAEVV